MCGHWHPSDVDVKAELLFGRRHNVRQCMKMHEALDCVAT